MNFYDARNSRENIKRLSWNDELIDIYLRYIDIGKYKIVIEHLAGKIEEHDYKMDISDFVADDWIIINKEF